VIDPGLEGRVAIVTGANHGIGAATSEALAAQGVRVLVAYLRLETEPRYPADYARAKAQSGQEVAERIGGAAMEVDLSDDGAVEALFDHAERELGPVEILVNNAAHCRVDTLRPEGRTVTRHELRRHFDVNTAAPALLTAELARRHTDSGRRWGRVVNVSTNGAFAFPGEVSYGVTKYALESLSRAAAVELAPLGITVNTVSPGPIDTGWMDVELAARLVPQIPLGRIGRPEDVADVILFLVSEQARWLTGQTISAAGGSKLT